MDKLHNKRSIHSKEVYQTSGDVTKSLATALDILRERLELINSEDYMKTNMITEEDLVFLRCKVGHIIFFLEIGNLFF